MKGPVGKELGQPPETEWHLADSQQGNSCKR